MTSLRGKVAIVGAADTQVGKLPQFSATGLCIDAARRAMADAKITKDKIDGLITSNSMAEPNMYHAEAMAEYLQIFPRYCMGIGLFAFFPFAMTLGRLILERASTKKRFHGDRVDGTPFNARTHAGDSN